MLVSLGRIPLLLQVVIVRINDNLLVEGGKYNHYYGIITMFLALGFISKLFDKTNLSDRCKLAMALGPSDLL